MSFLGLVLNLKNSIYAVCINKYKFCKPVFSPHSPPQHFKEIYPGMYRFPTLQANSKQQTSSLKSLKQMTNKVKN